MTWLHYFSIILISWHSFCVPSIYASLIDGQKELGLYSNDTQLCTTECLSCGCNDTTINLNSPLLPCTSLYENTTYPTNLNRPKDFYICTIIKGSKEDGYGCHSWGADAGY
jgi:hypothetical protein